MSKHAEALAIGDGLGVRDWVVDRSTVRLGQVLGNGAFGTVMACTISGDENVSAVAKQINPRKLAHDDVPLLKSELQIWSTLSHPNLVTFIGVCLAPSEYLLLCETMSGGTLETRLDLHLKEHRALPTQEELLDMMVPIADGMRYLHSKGIMHRDIKSANILIDGSRLAISDFGLSRLASPNGNKSEFTAETGSYRWMAPEVTRHEPYDQKCDVYSFGLLAYEMASYHKPFHTMTVLEAAFAVARDGLRPELPASCPEEITGVIRHCWRQRSEERPDFEEVHCGLLRIQKGASTRMLEASTDAMPTSKAHATTPGSSPPSPALSPSSAPLPAAQSSGLGTEEAGTGESGEAKRKVSGEGRGREASSAASSPASLQPASSAAGQDGGREVSEGEAAPREELREEPAMKRPRSISSALVDLAVGV